MIILISILKKNIDQINLTDINDLINQRVRESSLIEYKEADFINPSRRDLQQKFWKLVTIICGFANNMGGLLILGIKEDSNSCADSVTPLHQVKSSLINSLIGLTVSHTIPVISLQIIDIDTNSSNPDEYILVLKILETPEPVMYINGGDRANSHKYFFRYNEHTLPADHATVRTLFAKKNIEEKLNKYIERRNYGLKLGAEENVVCWISIPFQFPLETFTELNDSTISTLRRLYPGTSVDDRFHGIFQNGRYSHEGIMFLFRNRSLYYGFLEVIKNGYIEFKTFIKNDRGFLVENYIIKDFDKFLEYLYNFYTEYNYFGNIRIILGLQKIDTQLKLGIRQIPGEYLYDHPNNFSPENVIFIKSVFSINDLDSETKRSKIFTDFRTEVRACFGLS